VILLIDNYDSFSYNLYQLAGSIDPDIKVIRNDEMSVGEIRSLRPERLIISPGPGRPSDAGICEEAVRELAGEIPILGVCLGHQAIFEAFGGRIGYAKKLMHGKQSLADIDTQSPIFAGLGSTLKVARYHSLAADEDTVPDCLKVISRVHESADAAGSGDIMAVAHTEYPVYGLQFHPESILTPDGAVILKNFINM